MESLIGKLAMMIRREVVDSLMEGNDTQCFTTDQYMERYFQRERNGEEVDAYRRWWREENLARQHLQSLRCIEVKPDVWTLRSCD